jgi:hypothetical protein
VKKLWLFFLLLFLVGFLTVPFWTNQVHATTYTYTFYGPYCDDGSIPSDVGVLVALFNANSTYYSFILVSTAGDANTSIVYSSTPVTGIFWFSGAMQAYNYSRIYTPSSTSETIYVHIPTIGAPFFVYTFNVADFYGMVNPYLESTITHGGSTYVVERQSLNTTGVVSFVMTQWHPYGLTFQCVQGTYSQTFLASATFTNNLQVLRGDFPTTAENESAATAVRLNGTAIQINYTDPDSATIWVYVAITHREEAETIVDYTDNQTTSSSYGLLAIVDNETDYYAQVQAYRYGTVTEWDIPCPILYPFNPFSGLIDYLGTWPAGLDPSQLIPAAIIMLFLGLGSFRSAGVSCILAWVVGGIMIAIGWWQASIPLWSLAGVLSILVVIDESKQVAREA